MHRWLLIVALASTAALAEDWKVISSGRVTVKTRPVSGEAVREVRGETDLNADASDVERALLAADTYARFMPYVKESRFLSEPAADGSRLLYTRLVVPVVASRDWIVRARTMRSLERDGEFVAEWSVEPTGLPARAQVIRLTHNTGSWHVTPLGPGRCHIVYQFVVDLGGSLPAFLADIGNRSGVPDTLFAVEREANRLASPAAVVARR